MTEIAQEITRMQITTILNRYRFEMRGYSTQELLDVWLPTYSLDWIHMAVLEALYRGRYKAISVEEILKSWQRRGCPTYNFTYDFERLVCKNLPGGALESLASVPPNPVPADGGGKGDRENTEPDQSSIEMVKAALGTLDAPPFDDPRKVMSDVGELFSRLTVEVPTFAPESEGKKPGEGNDTETKEATGKGTIGHSIHEFIPLLDGSQLYSKLKAVARSRTD